MSNSEGPGLWLRTDDATVHGVSSYQRGQNIPLISNCYQYQPLTDQRASFLWIRKGRLPAAGDLGWKKWDIFIIEVGAWMARVT